MRNFNNEKETEEKDNIASMISMALDKPDIRALALYGDINEERCMEVIYALLTLDFTAKNLHLEDPENPDSPEIEVIEPIDFYISTYGGQATEMFAVYDIMRIVRDRTPIRTCGLGKVMSAGVLLLAAGTKGERRIGRNCRAMIHGVIAGQHGHIADIENEFSETKMTQKMYISRLSEETNMAEKDIRRMINKKTNVYINAEKAVELGIADIIF